MLSREEFNKRLAELEDKAKKRELELQLECPEEDLMPEHKVEQSKPSECSPES